jgi:hypothetical protein
VTPRGPRGRGLRGRGPGGLGPGTCEDREAAAARTARTVTPLVRKDGHRREHWDREDSKGGHRRGNWDSEGRPVLTVLRRGQRGQGTDEAQGRGCRSCRARASGYREDSGCRRRRRAVAGAVELSSRALSRGPRGPGAAARSLLLIRARPPSPPPSSPPAPLPSLGMHRGLGPGCREDPAGLPRGGAVLLHVIEHDT